MKRKCLFFGNGIGRSINNEYFKLENGIAHVWNIPEKDGGLTDDDKLRICQLTGKISSDPPHGEDDLLNLHTANTSCKNLKKVHSSSIPWLADPAIKFPDTINYFVGLIGKYYTDCTDYLPVDFTVNLVEFINKNPCHVITTNYDLLLYKKFIDYSILAGYNGKLIDGVTDSGFDKENLERKYANDFGWYLHLHGSPLYYKNSNDKILKYTIPNLQLSFSNRSKVHERQMVLTHSKFKPDVIIDSQLLSVYWDYFVRALYESDELYLVGYSGFDDHINNLISYWFDYDQTNIIHIIEYGNVADHASRLLYWANKLSENGKQPDIILMNNITDYKW